MKTEIKTNLVTTATFTCQPGDLKGLAEHLSILKLDVKDIKWDGSDSLIFTAEKSEPFGEVITKAIETLRAAPKKDCFGDRDTIGTPVCAGCLYDKECLQKTVKI